MFGTLEGKIFGVNIADGKEEWVYVTDGQISGAPNLLSRKDGSDFDILAGSYDFNLHCISGLTGKPRWKYETANYINGTPALFGKNAIFGGCDGHLYLVNTGNGELIEKMTREAELTVVLSRMLLPRDGNKICPQ